MIRFVCFFAVLFACGAGTGRADFSAANCPSPNLSFPEYKTALTKCMNDAGHKLTAKEMESLTDVEVEFRFNKQLAESLENAKINDQATNANRSDVILNNQSYPNLRSAMSTNSNNIYAIHKSLKEAITGYHKNKVALPVSEELLTQELFEGFAQTLPPINVSSISGEKSSRANISQSFAANNSTLLIAGGVAVGAVALSGGGGGGGCTSVPVRLSSTSRVIEGGTGTITASLDAPAEGNLMLNLSVSGSNGDHTPPSSISISRGSSTGSTSLVITDDNVYEGEERITISSTGACTLPGQTSMVIVENEPAPRVNIAVSSSSVSENIVGQSAQQIIVTATIDQIADEAIVVNFGGSGVASVGADYNIEGSVEIPALSSSGQTTINMIDDEIYEGDEAATINISSLSGADALRGAQSTALFTITEDDPLPNIRWVAPMASDLSLGEAGPLNANVIIETDRLASSDIVVTFDQDTSVPFPVGGSRATLGSDFEVHVASIPAGASTASTTISIIDDNIYDGANNEYAHIIMASASIGIIDSSHIEISIDDNDSAPKISLATSATSMDEKSGSAILTVTADRTADFDMVVSLSKLGTATDGVDYNVPSTITISALSLTGSATVTPVDDTNYENSLENIIIEIASVDGDGAYEDGNQQANIQITEFALNAGVQLAYDENLAETRRTSAEFKNFNAVGATSVQNPLEVINAHKAHGYGLDGSGETVMVVDDCANPNHPDLQNTNISYYGLNLLCNAGAYHGATVAGVIAADVGNGDLVGVAPGVDLVHADANNLTNTGSPNSIYKADKWAGATRFARDNGIIVQNNSWGPNDTPITTIQANMGANSSSAEVEIAADWGISRSNISGNSIRNYVNALNEYQNVGVVVFALSNTFALPDADTIAALPELFPELKEAWITAVNIDITGSQGNEVYTRKSAPCGQTAEYCLGSDGFQLAGLAFNNLYVLSTSGTSFVAPQISAAIAILAQAFPNHTPEQLVDRLLASANNTWFTPTGNVVFANSVVHGYHVEYGHGILDIYAALQPITQNSNARLAIYAGQESLSDPGYTLSGSALSTSRSFGDAVINGLMGETNYAYDNMNGGFAYDISGHIQQSGLTAKTINVYSEVNNLKKLQLGMGLKLASRFNDIKVGSQYELVKLSLTKGQATLPAQNFFENGTSLIESFDQYDMPYLSHNNNGLGFNAYVETDTRQYFFGFNPKIQDPESAEKLSQLREFQDLEKADDFFDMYRMQTWEDRVQEDRSDHLDTRTRRESSTILVGFNQRLSDTKTIGFISGLAVEDNGFLGLRGTGALSLAGAETNTVFSGVSFASYITPSFSIKSHALFARSNMDNNANTMLYGAEDIASDAYSIIVEKTNIIGDDKLEFGLSQPNRVSGGDMMVRISNLASPNGDITYTSKNISLEPTGRQIDLAFAYARNISADFSISTKVLQTRNLNHIKSEKDVLSGFVGLKYKNLLMGAAKMPYEDEFVLSYSTRF